MDYLKNGTSLDEPNYAVQEEKLKEELTKAETKKENYKKDLQEINSEINIYGMKRGGSHWKHQNCFISSS